MKQQKWQGYSKYSLDLSQAGGFRSPFTPLSRMFPSEFRPQTPEPGANSLSQDMARLRIEKNVVTANAAISTFGCGRSWLV